MPMRRRVGWLLLVALGLALVAGACGGGAKKAHTTLPAGYGRPGTVPEAELRHSFDKADANHDGAIDFAEKQATMETDFAAMDLNHDRLVTVEDVKLDLQSSSVKRPLDRPLDHYLAFDYDHNGRIDLTEYVRHVSQDFASMDRNGDGRFTWKEIRGFYLPKTPRATTTTRADVLGGSGAALLFLPFGLGRRIRRVAVVVGTVALVMVATAVPAAASAVYNQANEPYEVNFYCGIFCGTSWNIANGDWDAYPGEAGTYSIQNDNAVGCENTSNDGQVGVPGHGWSTLSSTGSSPFDISWTDFDNSGNGIKTVSIDVSGTYCNPLDGTA